MADPVKTKETFKIPGWVAVLISVLAIFVGGAGWINSALQARQDVNVVKNNGDIQMLKDEDDKQNQLIVSLVRSVSDIKTEVTDRLARIETTLNSIEKKVR